MIVWLRGASGAGKSWLVRELVEEYRIEDIWWPAGLPLPGDKMGHRRRRPIGHVLRGDLFVAGPYVLPGRRPAGFDVVSPAVVRVQIPFVERAAARFTHVLAESLFSSKTSPDRFLELRDRYPGRLVVALLDTPREVCLARMAQRPNGAPPRDETHRSNFERSWATQLKLEAGGIGAVIDYLDASTWIKETLRRGGWQP